MQLARMAHEKSNMSVFIFYFECEEINNPANFNNKFHEKNERYTAREKY